MKIVIIQGRLMPPDNGFQDTPADWRGEFERLRKLDMNHVEWIVTKESFDNNPIFKENVIDYPISSICADHVVDNRVANREFLFASMKPICEAAQRNNIRNVTIPLLEDSDVNDDVIRAEFCESVAELAKKYENLNFSIEAELHPDKLIEIIELGDNFSVTYDTGNITSCKLDHEEYIDRLANRISNVHLKDRTFDAGTVDPTTGDTNFNLIFQKLCDINYTGIFTIQTARGEYGQEVETINKHKKIFEEIYNECKRDV